MTQSTQSTNAATSNTTQNYAGFQAPALQTAFDAAGTALGQAQNAPTPTDFTAQFTPQMMQAFQNELGYGSNAGANPVVNATNGASTALSNAGSNAAAQGLYGLQNFTPAGGTQSNINAANAYAAADAPNIQGAVQQGMLAANQNYSDVQAPAIQRNAAGTGNINSTAPSISQGILQRGLAEQAATMGSSLSNADYQNALNLARHAVQPAEPDAACTAPWAHPRRHVGRWYGRRSRHPRDQSGHRPLRHRQHWRLEPHRRQPSRPHESASSRTSSTSTTRSLL